MKPSYRRYILLGVVLMVAAVVAGAYLLLTVGDGTVREVPTEEQVLDAAPVSVATASGAAPSTTARASAAATTTAPSGAKATTTTVRRTKDANGFTLVRATQLPKEAQQTLALIDKGGPYPYERDGIVFQNRERILPAQASGYYREYTVVTPGSSDRGARRIVVGRGGERYYTADHYESFVRVEAAA